MMGWYEMVGMFLGVIIVDDEVIEFFDFFYCGIYGLDWIQIFYCCFGDVVVLGVCCFGIV